MVPSYVSGCAIEITENGVNMKTGLGIICGVVVGAIAGAGVVLVGRMSRAPANPVSVQEGPLLELNGKSYAKSDLPPYLQSEIFDTRTEAYDQTLGLLNKAGVQLVLSKDKGVDLTKTLPTFEALLEIGEPSPLEIETLYENNREQLPPGTTFESIKPDLVKHAKSQKLGETLREKNKEFIQTKRLKILLAAPEAPRFDIDLKAYVGKGAPTSPTLVEVADYLCSNCQIVQLEIQELLKGDLDKKIRFVPVPYSLKPDRLSGSLARGAYCAKLQGDESFWKYHETAYRIATNKAWKPGDPAAKELVLEVAKEAGIDVPKMEACVESPEAVAFVANTATVFNELGLNGTPMFYYEGRKLLVKVSLKKALNDLNPASM